ncbi:hypothetical protein RD110_08120 [Rhodoferax koreense]|uniref:Uncharacterized protein n=1 Tax=Rhodoferax koreensis TaxID=1842727 RepID=A0A1P8JTT2_9BURK|nr:hypothetical protein RD110_08120 [Rhodoferax koreense]
MFQGPDEATPEQVTAFAQQHFGKATPAAPAAAPAPQATPDDPGAFMSALIGAGRTTDNIIDGMKQLGFNLTGDKAALEQLRADHEEKTRLYKPLQEQHAITTAIGEALPSMVVPVGGAAGVAGNVARLAVAGAAPGALEYGTAGERAGRAAGGAVAGVAGGAVVPAVARAVSKVVPAIGRTAKALTEPLYEGGRQAIAGRTLNRAAGEGADDVVQRLAGAAGLVPGSLPTAAQVAENGGIAALERSVAAAQPAEFAQRGMEQAAARTGALRDMAGDATSRAAAVDARKAATKGLYSQAAQANYTMDPQLQRLLQTPAMQEALAMAKKLAENNQRPFTFNVEPPSPFGGLGVKGPAASTQITGQGLHDLKMAVDTMLKDPASGYAGSAGDSVKALRGQLLNWMESRNPAYRQARTTYADMSKPIGQMDIGQELLTKLEPALNDYGGLARETGNKFATALRNADQTAVKATKFKGSGMADVMTPDQMRTLEGIAGDLARKANAQDLGRGVGSDTFQKLAMSNIANQSGAPGVVGGALNFPGVSKVAKFLYAGPEEKIQTIIAQALLEPKSAAKLMGEQIQRGAPQSATDVLFANPKRATQVLGGLAGLSTGNFLAQ